MDEKLIDLCRHRSVDLFVSIVGKFMRCSMLLDS